MHIVTKKIIEIYVTDEGNKPFQEWLNKLKDKQARYLIKTRLDRIALGNMGDSKPIKGGEGIHELRIAHGPGY